MCVCVISFGLGRLFVFVLGFVVRVLAFAFGLVGGRPWPVRAAFLPSAGV